MYLKVTFCSTRDWHTQNKHFIIELHPQPSPLTFILKQGHFVVAQAYLELTVAQSNLEIAIFFPQLPKYLVFQVTFTTSDF